MSEFVLEASWLAGQQAPSLPLGWLVSAGLVELDIDYAKKAKTWGVPFYGRAPALGDNPSYIKCLENSVRRLVAEKLTLKPGCSAG